MEVSSFDSNPMQKAYLQAKRVNNQCLGCGDTCTSSLCDSCQTVLNFKPKSKRLPKLLDYDERKLMEKMQLELKASEDKKEVQDVIDFLVETGRKRFKDRRVAILQSASEKKYTCQSCGRPVSHAGQCLNCNRIKKGCRHQAAEKDRDSTERLSRQGIHCQRAVGNTFSQQPDADNP
jgi:hypothetical protein